MAAKQKKINNSLLCNGAETVITFVPPPLALEMVVDNFPTIFPANFIEGCIANRCMTIEELVPSLPALLQIIVPPWPAPDITLVISVLLALLVVLITRFLPDAGVDTSDEDDALTAAVLPQGHVTFMILGATADSLLLLFVLITRASGFTEVRDVRPLISCISTSPFRVADVLLLLFKSETVAPDGLISIVGGSLPQLLVVPTIWSCEDEVRPVVRPRLWPNVLSVSSVVWEFTDCISDPGVVPVSAVVVATAMGDNIEVIELFSLSETQLTVPAVWETPPLSIVTTAWLLLPLVWLSVATCPGTAGRLTSVLAGSAHCFSSCFWARCFAMLVCKETTPANHWNHKENICRACFQIQP